MTEAPLRRYFKLPRDVKPGDFVHQLERTGSAAAVEETLRLYHVTPSIARNLDEALAKVAGGLEGGRSVFTWIHGSFGSGKSHFMNVLSLLLADEKAVYAVHPELQEQRAKYHPGAIGRQLLRVHVQCISRGASTLEEIVLGAATEELGRLHPDAPAPALFESSKLFASAERLLADLGEERFFGAFPSNKKGRGDWGDFEAPWDLRRFEAAIAAPRSEEARALAGELAKTPWLQGMAASADFVSLGPGLQILGDHVARLGYEGVVLFLDELVLWLATTSQEVLSREARKVSTLVEHGDYPPKVPFVTFAARQRDLSQMVGNLPVGRDEVIFRDQLSFWKDRFSDVSLENKDLPAIIEKRLLAPVSPEAKAEIEAAFERFKRESAMDFRRLGGHEEEGEDFRRMYPLSPALVDVMVSLSSTLQRDRTALRELTRLLVDYLPDFELGKVVPVGDLFDVVTHGQASERREIQSLYEKAKKIYEDDLLPHIRKKEKTDSPDKCQILRETHDPRLGCAGCAQSGCRAQTRIAKTVLLQGLVPRTGALKELRASSLVWLNSGVLQRKGLVDAMLRSRVAKMLTEWAAITPAVHVTEGDDPLVRAVLDVVDVRRILDASIELDNEQRRRIRVRDLLFEAMGVAQKDQAGSRTFEWRNRRWRVGVVYDNTRLANEHVFRPGEDEDLRVVLDYPFDEPGKGPRDDEEKIGQIVEGLAGDAAARGLATLVWLPAFLDEDTKEVLKHLVILDGLVGSSDHDLAQRLPWVSLDDLPRVRATLAQQRELKQGQIRRVLEAAYGVRRDAQAPLAPGLAPERHVHLLRKEAKIDLPSDRAFDRALESVLKQALEARAPRHPELGKAPTRARLEAVLEMLGKLLETPERRARFDRGQSEDLRAIAGAKYLEIVRIPEDEATYTGGILEQVTRNLANHQGALSVGAVRRALDPDRLMELSAELEDFLVLAYAKAAPRPLRLFAQGQAAAGLVGKLSDDLALVPVELPGLDVWHRALGAGELIGVATGKALTPARMEEVAAIARAKARAFTDAGLLDKAIAGLREWQALAGVAEPVELTQRGSVLVGLKELADAVAGAAASEPLAVIEALARFPVDRARTTALLKMGTPAAVQGIVSALGSQAGKAAIGAGRKLEGEAGAEVRGVMEEVRRALVFDENVIPLGAALEKAVTEITRVIVGRSSAAIREPARPEAGTTGGWNVIEEPARPEVGTAGTRGAGGAPVGSSGEVRAAPPLVSEKLTVASEEDVARLVERLRGRVEAGERLVITIEPASGGRR